MNSTLANRSRAHFFAMRVLHRASCVTQRVSQWLAARSQRQEAIAAALWAEAVAAGKRAEAPR